MKNNTIKYLFGLGLLLFLIACSTRKNTFLSRNSHALSTRDNILFNGQKALDKGVHEVALQNVDNFWEILPIERMQIKEVKTLATPEAKNANFELAETKATKAIQKHSMYIQGSEKNPQMDEAHLLLGKARYYDQRFVPALEAFNYVLSKYPNSDKIYEVKIWREKTNMRLENDGLAANNLRKLLKEIKFKDQIFADANAALAQAYINLGEKDSAVFRIKTAIKFTKSKEEKSRYRFILAQLFGELGKKDSAFVNYQRVIDMKRKAGRQYVMHAHAQQAAQFDPKKGDTIAFLKKFNALLADRENRPHLDVLHHQVALFYDQQKKYTQAQKQYNFSLRMGTKYKSQDTYLKASNYRNLATIYFNTAKYVMAGKYYDSTLVQLKPRSREYNLIKKKRLNLNDVIKYEKIANHHDSIISLYSMSNADRISYYDSYIKKLIQKEEADKKLAEKEAIKKENEAKDDGRIDMPNSSKPKPADSFNNTSASGKANEFYFYNQTLVEFGKKEFIKNWGKRTLQDYWRVASIASKMNTKTPEAKENDSGTNKEVAEKPTKETKNSKEVKPVDEKHTPEYYIKQIPTSQIKINDLSKERNFAYFQLGSIYKEKFKEYKLAVNKYEQLLKNNPEDRFILPSMYNLYKLYEILSDKNKAEAMKARIISQYPDSRYAQILQNPNGEIAEASDSPKSVYVSLYKEYRKGDDLKALLPKVESAIEMFNGEDVMPKLELLKAYIVGKLSGLAEYQNLLNNVFVNYPNTEESKKVETILNVSLPKLEALQLGNYPSKNWKILYSTKDFEDNNTKTLRKKIEKFIKDRGLEKLSISLDVYTMADNFVVIHGMNSEDLAKNIATILKDYKDFKIEDKPIIISSENYTVVQIKKNLEEYLAGNLPDQPALPDWDGTIEKTIESQDAIPQENEAPKMNSDDARGSNRNVPMQPNGVPAGMPPSPQMGMPDRK